MTFQVSKFALELDWLPGDGMLDPAEAATYAELELRIGASTVTECADASDSVRKSVLLPSILLAEWIVGAWVELFADERRPVAEEEAGVLELDAEVTRRREAAVLEGHVEAELDGWSRAHCLRRGRHGFPLPDLVFVREQDTLAVGWRPSTAGRVRFITPEASARVSADEASASLIRCVTKTLQRLDAMKVQTKRTEELERAWAALNDKKHLKRVIAARGGRSWDSLRKLLDHDGQNTFDALGISPDLPPISAWKADSVVLGLLRSSEPKLTRADIEAFRAVTDVAKKRRVEAALTKAREALVACGATQTTDHQRGQERARSLRDHWGLSLDSPLLDLEERVKKLLGGPVIECPLGDPRVDALCAWDPAAGAAVGVNPGAVMGGTKVGRRMAIAHEVAHLLFHVHAGQPLGIASGPWAIPSLEREGNAFAAELLLPLEAGRKALGKRRVTLEIAREIGAKFEVSIETTIWQLANRVGALSRGEARALLRGAVEGNPRSASARAPAKRTSSARPTRSRVAGR